MNINLKKALYKTSYGLMYYKSTDNIGDDIQTYAAMKFLPHIDYYIDREDLSCFVPDKIK